MARLRSVSSIHSFFFGFVILGIVMFSISVRVVNESLVAKGMEKADFLDFIKPSPSIQDDALRLQFTNDKAYSTKILLTNYGWNSPDPRIATRRYRSLRSKYFLQTLEKLPHFDANLWNQLLLQLKGTNTTKDKVLLVQNTKYFVFVDVEFCPERNWPFYGRGTQGNADPLQTVQIFRGAKSSCQFLEEALSDLKLILKTFPNVWARLVVVECFGEGPKLCMMRNHTEPPEPFLLVSASARKDQHVAYLDQGLPPPAVIAVNLTQAERTDLCSNRPYFLFFAGNFRSKVRKVIKALDNGRDIRTDPDHVVMRAGGAELFSDYMRQTRFGVVPRGDNLFSYRFTEVLSAGAIPVVLADDWVLPFRPELVDWESCCVVVVREENASDLVSILSKITPERRCEMQRNGLAVYEKYLSSMDAIAAGVLEGLEIVAKQNGAVNLR